MELKANGQTVTTEMDLANSIRFKIGGGILINQKHLYLLTIWD